MLLQKLINLLSGGLIVYLSLFFVIGAAIAMHYGLEGKSNLTIPLLKKYSFTKIVCTLSLISVLIPPPDTIKYMAGAYLIQITYESDFVQEAGSLAGKAVTNQLRKWAESNPDIDTLLESVEVTKEKADSVVK